jgi:hypothetical protein
VFLRTRSIGEVAVYAINVDLSAGQYALKIDNGDLHHSDSIVHRDYNHTRRLQKTKAVCRLMDGGRDIQTGKFFMVIDILGSNIEEVVEVAKGPLSRSVATKFGKILNVRCVPCKLWLKLVNHGAYLCTMYFISISTAFCTSLVHVITCVSDF